MRRSLLDWVLGYEPDEPLPVLFTDCCEDCGWPDYELHPDENGDPEAYCPKCGALLEVIPSSMWDEGQMERATARKLWEDIQETRRKTGIFCGHIYSADIHVSKAVDKTAVHHLPESAAAGQTQQTVE